MFRALLRNAGIKPKRWLSTLAGWSRYRRDRDEYRRLAAGKGIPWGKELPILHEWTETSGGLGAYFQQDLAVAKWIHATRPERHIDVGSRIDGFIGHLAVFREVEVIDIRPAPGKVAGIRFHQLDIMEALPKEWIECTDSLSCLHTIEHFGLGRYGDPIDPEGHLKGLEQLKRMVARGGLLYLSTPIGPERVEFNAHRIFSAETVRSWFGENWNIERFAVIDDDARLRESVDWNGPEVSIHFGCRAGVGIVVARKQR
jgi:hypothetical protein